MKGRSGDEYNGDKLHKYSGILDYWMSLFIKLRETVSIVFFLFFRAKIL